jgi:diacylglycerol kinase (ATP)
MKNKDLISSLNNAFAGFKYSLKNERNMKIHVSFTIAVALFALFTDISKLEFLSLTISISLVFICELFNTAIEVLINAIIKVHHPKAKIVKDVAAASVLISALNALIIGYIVFIDRISTGLEMLITRISSYPPNMILVILIVTVSLVLIIKTITNRGTPFQGGIPSGHSAIAFSIATSIALWSGNVTIAFFAFLLAFLVAQSRIEGKIHTLIEVLLGGIIGLLVTVLIYKLLL